MAAISPRLHSALRGALGGALATAPMTAAMVGIHKMLPAQHQDPLPPQKIVEDLGSAAGAESRLPAEQKQPLVWTAHYSYGALMGAIYGGLIAHEHRSRAPIAEGICFGLGVWAANYLLGLPAVGMRASAYREPNDRNAMMILSHVVWGGTLGALDATPVLERPSAPPPASKTSRIAEPACDV